MAALMHAEGALRRLGGKGGRSLLACLVTCAVAIGMAACSDVDPYEVQCKELVTSPDRIRETSLKLAGNSVKKKVRYEQEIERICANAPEDYRPVPKIKPKG